MKKYLFASIPFILAMLVDVISVTEIYPNKRVLLVLLLLMTAIIVMLPNRFFKKGDKTEGGKL